MHTITTASYNDYARIYDRLWEEACGKVHATQGEDAEPTGADLVQVLLSKVLRPDLYSLNTLVKYRSALVAMLPRNAPLGWEAARQSLQSLAMRASVESAREQISQGSEDNDHAGVIYLAKVGRRPSQRMIPEEDFKPLIANLEWQSNEPGEGSIWRERAALALRAGVASGCRPIEWLGAHWADREAGILRIYTAKQKIASHILERLDDVPPLTFLDGEDELARLEDKERWTEIDSLVREKEFSRKIIFLRSLGISTEVIDALIGQKTPDANITSFRDVVIETEFQDAVDKHMAQVRAVMQAALEKHARKFPGKEIPIEEIFTEKYATTVRVTIWRACKKAFLDGRKYSLADCRSTFAANRKALAGLKATALAMGHAWPQTTRDFYAPARKAWSRYANAGPRMLELAKESMRLAGLSQGVVTGPAPVLTRP